MAIETYPIHGKLEPPESAKEFYINFNGQEGISLLLSPEKQQTRIHWLATGVTKETFLRILRELGCTDDTKTVYCGEEMTLHEAERKVGGAYRSGELNCTKGQTIFFWEGCGPLNMGHTTVVGLTFKQRPPFDLIKKLHDLTVSASEYPNKQPMPLEIENILEELSK